MKHSKKYTRKRHIKRKYNKKKYTKKRYTKRRHRRMRGGKPIGVGALVAAGAVGACLLGPAGAKCRQRQERKRAVGQTSATRQLGKMPHLGTPIYNPAPTR